MTKEELAAKLNYREYRFEITKEEEREAKEGGLVVLYGASDDLAEFAGAISDEESCFEGGSIPLTKDGILQNVCMDEDCPYFKLVEKQARHIKAVWGKEDYSWTYETDIPHATFDILECGEKYCRGIVFNLSDIS